VGNQSARRKVTFKDWPILSSILPRRAAIIPLVAKVVLLRQSEAVMANLSYDLMDQACADDIEWYNAANGSIGGAFSSFAIGF
jgi:hypothetical protein